MRLVAICGPRHGCAIEFSAIKVSAIKVFYCMYSDSEKGLALAIWLSIIIICLDLMLPNILNSTFLLATGHQMLDTYLTGELYISFQNHE